MTFWRYREECLDQEIQDYLDRQTEENRARGLTPGEARCAARRKLGPVLRVKEDTRAAWGWVWLERLLQDLRYGWRMLAKDPGFTLVAVLSLGIGVGANSAMFSLADVFLLRPLSVPRSSEVLTLGSTNLRSAARDDFLRASYPDYLDIRNHSNSFVGLAAFKLISVQFKTKPDALPRVKTGMLASGNLFRVMEVEPELGRDFRPDEDQAPGRHAVAVLNHNFWEQEFAADPAIVGHTVWMNGLEFTVIGVLPSKFTGLDGWVQPAFYVPTMMGPRLDGSLQDTLQRRDSRGFTVKGRLKPGVTIDQAQAEVSAIATKLEKNYPETNRDQNFAVRTELQARIRALPQSLVLVITLLILAAAVLLVACANVAALLISRGLVRSREMALRFAIGAGRCRLIRQLITESLLLAGAGALAGLPLGYAGVVLIREIPYPSDVPVVLSFQLNQRALVFSLAVALSSVFLFGLGPAILTTRTSQAGALKISGDVVGGRSFRARNVLVAAQLAISFVLLAVTTFMYTDFQRDLATGPGFRTDHLLMMTFDASLMRYSSKQTGQFFEKLLDRSKSQRGVKAAALTSFGPLNFYAEGTVLDREGYHSPPGKQSSLAMMSRVSDGYFETMGIPLLEGRDFQQTDTARSPHVAVVNETTARHYWPGQSSVGKRFWLNNRNSPLVEIVGVAKDSKYINLEEPPTDWVYLPYVQNPVPRMVLMVATVAPSADLIAPMRDAAGRVDADMPVLDVRTMEEFYKMRGVRTIVVIVQLFIAIGLMGLLLALIGLYGSVSYAVKRRTREIGIRMAIGADPWQILSLVLRQGFQLTICGLGAGLLLSVGAREAMVAAFPFHDRQVSEVAVYPLLAIALLLVATLAAYIPARHASCVDPGTTLRHD